MMDTFRGVLKTNKLELYAEKSKVLVFNKKDKEKKEKYELGKKRYRRGTRIQIFRFCI